MFGFLCKQGESSLRHLKKANSVGPDEKPQNMTSDQGLHCLHTGLLIKNIKNKKVHQTPLERKMDLSSL